MEELTLKEIHEETVKVLKKIHEICEANNLKYWLAFGTLIGAIRHKGFIPWDDDLDIWMPRDDFEKFKEICRTQDLGNYKLCDRTNTNNYTFYIPRFSNMDYKYITTTKNRKEFDIGIFVDIYPVDNFCNNESDSKSLLRKVIKKNQKYEIYVNGKSYTDTFSLKSYIKQIIHCFLKVRYGKNYNLKIDQEIDSLIKKNTSESDKYIGMVAWITMEWFCQFERDILDESILVDFENEKFWIPAKYDEILKAYYGDYMKLPPEKDRVPHHEYKIIRRI